MAERNISGSKSGGTTDIGADGVARGISGWTWGTVGLLALIVIIGALLIGGFFSMGQRGQKLNSDNRGAERPAEP